MAPGWRTRGGSPFVILQAGYLGTAPFGAGCCCSPTRRAAPPDCDGLGGLIALPSAHSTCTSTISPPGIVVTGGGSWWAILLILTRDSGLAGDRL